MSGVNLFDRATLDIPALFQKESSFKTVRNPLAPVYQSGLLPLKWRKYLSMLLTQTNADVFWFHEFKHYWSKTLGLRPMWGVEDFYYLRGHYRAYHQDAEMEDQSVGGHLKAWQSPKLIYFLLQQVYVESRYKKTDVLDLVQRYTPRRPQRFLEYGAGIGSITKTILEFDKKLGKSEFVLMDIPNLAFHYAKTRYAKDKNIHCRTLQESERLQPPIEEKFDTIFCTTVYEHLNSPIETSRRFLEMLKPGGHLVFDYVKSDADGLDTIAGLKERRETLEFLSENFEFLNRCDLDLDESVPLVIGRKKN